MNKYKVMLVDDEEDVAQAIMRKLNWEEMRFDTPRYAHNGLEALEFAEELRPDIVMSDIKMPYMDGMELARNLKRLYPNIRIIFFSGFDEFEYAKEYDDQSCKEGIFIGMLDALGILLFKNLNISGYYKSDAKKHAYCKCQNLNSHLINYCLYVHNHSPAFFLSSGHLPCLILY